MQRLWDEIRRRNLHRVTAAYAVVAWVLVQVAGLVFPAFDVPAWALRLVIALLIAGLPIVWVALWLAHPVVERDDTPRSRVHHTEWTLIGLLALVLIASLGEFAWSSFHNRPTAVAATSASQDASIAVLAFENMSDDPKNEFFSEGISEELLNDLVQVRGLRVAGRTSSFSFKGKGVGIPEIGKALHVHTVLEGSVRREGNRVRITAQLVNTADDFEIWSKTYDREISDIFSVQDEISRAIVNELTGRLLGARSTKENHKIDPDAYTAYLKGRFFMNRRNADDMQRAVGFFKQAIGVAPDYADAHASLGMAYELLFSNGQDRDALGPAESETATALKLQPGNFTALLASALIADASWHWSQGGALFRELLARYPNSAEAHHFYGGYLLFIDALDASLAEHRRAAALDPLSPANVKNVGNALYLLGRYREAETYFRDALALDPSFYSALGDLCMAQAGNGELDDADKSLSQLGAHDGGGRAYACASAIAQKKGDVQQLRNLARKAEQDYQSGGAYASGVAELYAHAGDTDAAMQWFEKAYDEKDGVLFWIVWDPQLSAGLKATPRWKAFMQRPAFQEMARVRAKITAVLPQR